MKPLPLGLFVCVSLALTSSPATTLYVDVNSATPSRPYTNWATAARVIQDAVDASAPGDLVLVSNGVYRTGGRVLNGSLTNRVAINKAVTVQSVNGPMFTIIVGNQVSGTTNGNTAVRCAYLTNNASLIGFTLTNGATRTSGDVIREQSGGGVCCQSLSGLVTDCIIVGNSASAYGGGANSGSLSNCTLVGNVVYNSGGAASQSTLRYCTLTANLAKTSGGGAYLGSLINSTVARNWAASGGGAHTTTATNCFLLDNVATSSGGGFYGGSSGVLMGCTVARNRAGTSGGGAYQGRLINTTLTGNTAGTSGGGAQTCNAYNCILYYNSALVGSNFYFGSLEFCCTTPKPETGSENIETEPQLASPSHLSLNSPCSWIGNARYTTGTDIDGEAWAIPPSLGCDEPTPLSATGDIQVAIQASYTNVSVGCLVDFSADISGKVTNSQWEWDDGTILTNLPYVSRRWLVPGDYSVVLRAFNADHPEGVTATATIHVVTPPIHYVSLNNPAPLAPYSSWQTAATNIQAAVDAATVPGSLILVSNGIYAAGGKVVYGKLTNRLAITKPLNVQSVNGPSVTVIRGNQVAGTTGSSAVRCAYLASGALLGGFTFENGATVSSGDANLEQSGGAVWCESALSYVSNCVISGSVAQFAGGGVYGGTLTGCYLSTNLAKGFGGGATFCALENCTVAGNLAWDSGGGVYWSTARTCILTANSAGSGGGAYHSAVSSSTITNNSATSKGGGVSEGWLDGCLLAANSADYMGGGAYSATLTKCTLAANSAADGGGAYQGTLTTCAVSGNSATNSGGGCNSGILNNCTVTGNHAATGGGVSGGLVTNCIVYYNSALGGANYRFGLMDHCCTTPLPSEGFANFDAEPLLASASHLSAASPCVATGNQATAAGVDFDGQPWANPPSVGCDEPAARNSAGEIFPSIEMPYNEIATGCTLELRALISGEAVASRWEFDDGTVLSNRPYASRQWAMPGEYQIVLRAYNEAYPSGVAATAVVRVIEPPVHYVSLESQNPQAPFSTWAAAATNIQDAIDAASVPGAIILVSNGVYAVGARRVDGSISNRVAVTKPVKVVSASGPSVTLIEGAQSPDAVRCVYLAKYASLSGFTLTNGATWKSGEDYKFNYGGGVWCESVTAGISNCVLVGNTALFGGGAFQGTLNSCTIAGNSANYGGGAAFANVTNCTIETNYCPTYQAAGGGVYQSSGADCRLSANSARQGGGAFLSSLRNCTMVGNSAEEGAAANASVLTGCTVVSNTAGFHGGGVAGGSAARCTLSRNTADTGGGAYESALSDCALAANNARNGGGSYAGSLYKCEMLGNSAILQGGGCYAGFLTSCVITGNSATEGGGAYGSAMTGCALTGNSASEGGGVSMGILVNCTITANIATNWIGGVKGSTLTNCIVYYNTAPNYDYSFLSHTCTTPLPPSGINNFDAEPALASALHIAPGSPCQGRGLPMLTHQTDIDGQGWANPPSVGCDEPAATTVGPIQVDIRTTYTTFGLNFATDFTSLISGQVSASRWEFDDGTIVSNRLSIIHAWTNGGDFPVVLRAYNSDYPEGVSATLTVHVINQPLYVSLDNPSPAPPYDSWMTAATNIQDAVDVAPIGGLVLVSNGVYKTGGRSVNNGTTNRVVVDKPLTLRSVNGPESTVIMGYQLPDLTNGVDAVRGLYLGKRSVLAGFTVTNGATLTSDLNSQDTSGGGILAEGPEVTVSNCVLSGNSAWHWGAGAYRGTYYQCHFTGNFGFYGSGGGAGGAALTDCSLVNNYADYGGGAWGATLTNCTITANRANGEGGGVCSSILNGCTVLSNRVANWGGGAAESTLHNCVLAYNQAEFLGGGAYAGSFNHCSFISNSTVFTYANGGGVFKSSLTNCVLTGNSSNSGGAADSATLLNCLVRGNSARSAGGGTYYGTTINSTIVSNSAPWGGGAFAGSLTNCVIYFNTADSGVNFPDGSPYSSILNFCCTTPLPTNGVANFTNAPVFVDVASADLRLQSNSPCINAGNNLFALGSRDLDGNPRIVSGTVDVGAYEYQGAGSTISYAWLQQYGLPTDGSADHIDIDQDNADNWHEWIAGTDPTDPQAALRVVSVTNISSGLEVAWTSVTNRFYTLERATTLVSPPYFSAIATNIVGLQTITLLADTNPPSPPLYYRVRVQE